MNSYGSRCPTFADIVSNELAGAGDAGFASRMECRKGFRQQVPKSSHTESPLSPTPSLSDSLFNDISAGYSDSDSCGVEEYNQEYRAFKNLDTRFPISTSLPHARAASFQQDTKHQSRASRRSFPSGPSGFHTKNSVQHDSNLGQ